MFNWVKSEVINLEITKLPKIIREDLDYFLITMEVVLKLGHLTRSLNLAWVCLQVDFFLESLAKEKTTKHLFKTITIEVHQRKEAVWVRRKD
jgi:hypothetical protein